MSVEQEQELLARVRDLERVVTFLCQNAKQPENYGWRNNPSEQRDVNAWVAVQERGLIHQEP